MIGIIVSLVVLYVTLAWFFQQVQRKRNKWPPGPFAFPIIGNFPQIMMTDAEKPYAAFHQLATKTYGDVMSIQLGATSSVVLSGFETIKKCMNSDQFLARFAPDWFISRTFGKPLGIIFGSIPIWRESRRFCVRNLREFGFGKRHTMESIIVQEIEEFTKRVDTNVPTSMHTAFDAAVVNSVFAMLCGFRFEQNDPELRTLLQLIHEYFSTIKHGADVIAAYPMLARLFPNYYKQQKVNKAVHAFFRKLIKDTRDRGTYKDDPQNFVDIFVSKIDHVTSSREDEIDDQVFTDENLLSILYDFFIAGAETTSTAQEFLILYLILHPEVQEKLAQEINEKIGRERWPTFEDRENMPYAESVIMETLRIATVLPLGPRQTAEDAHIGPYVIPKNTFVAVNYYSVHMDKTYWKDPESFRPERFIDENGRLCNTERLIPFSLGKRNCLGENLAKMNLFLFTTRLFQVYRISQDLTRKKPTLNPLVGVTMAPRPYHAVFTHR